MVLHGRVGVAKRPTTEKTMPAELLATFISILEAVFRPAVTRPSFSNLLVVMVGWILCPGRVHTIAEALVSASVAGRRHHEAFHRFFSRGTWAPDTVGFFLLDQLQRHSGDGPLKVVLDDTLAPKKGPHVFGLGTHLDAVRSTRRHRVFSFGHCWVVLAVLIRVPFSQRTWALPVLFRLYRNRHECERTGAVYRKKTELAREMLDRLLSWTAERRIHVAADSAYCNDTVLGGLPTRVVVFGTMRSDAVLTAAPVVDPAARRRGGRPPKRGVALPKPCEVAADEHQPWRRCQAFLYGRVQAIRYKTFSAQWYRVCGERMLRVVIVRTSSGTMPYRIFFCTNEAVDVRSLLEAYGERWGIEVFFRESKQLLGFADSPARTEGAVLRMAPWVGYLYSTLVLWFIDGAYQSPLAVPPVRPWYRHKQGLSFADILRSAQRVLHQVDVLALANHFNNLRNPDVTSATPEKFDISMAA
jgi:hypothetical protein